VNSSQKFSGVIMAGGRSTRMGRDKALLQTKGGHTLLQHAANTLRAAGAAEVIVSTARARAYDLPDTREVYDALQNCGPIAGLCACLDAAAENLCLVLAVDLPAMTASYLRAMLTRAKEDCGVLPVLAGSFEPLCAIYPKSALDVVVQAVKSGDYSLQRLLSTLELRGLATRMEISPHDRLLFANWNTPQDLPSGA
jgi:molybdopterin-guanine dinucleotide biosynthesis protein A